MTDRGAAPSDRATACPFVAFDDDRDERADRPDHRHRCYAEVRPAPRALAHQESYCLSPRFPSCPTFQDWARREAAQARTSASRGASDARAERVSADDPGSAGPSAEPADGAAAPAVGAAAGALGAEVAAAGDAEAPDLYEDDLAPRNRQGRDWAAPPPWVGGAADGRNGQGTGRAAAPGAGLANSRWLADVKSGDTASAAGGEGSLVGAARDDGPFLVEATPRPELAGLVGRPRRPARETATDRSRRERPVVGQARPLAPSARGRDPDDPTPAWERPRRFEAYPSIRSRVAMPDVPRAALGVVALLVAALLLFTLPALFLSKNGPAAVASESPGASPSVSLAPTASPVATPLTYTVMKNDTLTKIAQKFKVTQAAILKANPSLKDANLIAVGQVLIIPTPPPPDVIKSSAGSSASPSASAP